MPAPTSVRLSSENLPQPIKFEDEIGRVAHIFDDELSKRRAIPEKKNGWYTLRGDLAIQKRHATARREILRLLNEQVKVLAQAGLG
jgi:hypothetical protein